MDLTVVSTIVMAFTIAALLFWVLPKYEVSSKRRADYEERLRSFLEWMKKPYSEYDTQTPFDYGNLSSSDAVIYVLERKNETARLTIEKLEKELNRLELMSPIMPFTAAPEFWWLDR